MSRKGCALLVIGIVAVGATLLYLQNNEEEIPFNSTFDNGGRYDSTILNDLGIVYVSQSDIYAFNEGWSDSDNCPWGFEHRGIDYFMYNNSDVIAAAPGLVVEVSWQEYPESTYNGFLIHVNIQFNESLTIGYCFEPFTLNATDKDLQLEMLEVEEGDWVAKGNKIADFLNIGGGAHIHFDIWLDDEFSSIMNYITQETHDELLSLIHTYHPTWELYYP
ncbi:MAG: M23 family metallopeptidase [Candidatus Thorarchaeota archaeon]